MHRYTELSTCVKARARTTPHCAEALVAVHVAATSAPVHVAVAVLTHCSTPPPLHRALQARLEAYSALEHRLAVTSPRQPSGASPRPHAAHLGGSLNLLVSTRTPAARSAQLQLRTLAPLTGASLSQHTWPCIAGQRSSSCRQVSARGRPSANEWARARAGPRSRGVGERRHSSTHAAAHPGSSELARAHAASARWPALMRRRRAPPSRAARGSASCASAP